MFRILEMVLDKLHASETCSKLLFSETSCAYLRLGVHNVGAEVLPALIDAARTERFHKKLL